MKRIIFILDQYLERIILLIIAITLISINSNLLKLNKRTNSTQDSVETLGYSISDIVPALDGIREEIERLP